MANATHNLLNRNKLHHFHHELTSKHADPTKLMNSMQDLKKVISYAHRMRSQMLLKSEKGAFKKLIKRYHLTDPQAINMVTQISNFSDQYASILMKMLHGEPVHLASPSSHSDSPQQNEANSATDSDDDSDGQDD